jgi:hypothetical protein
VTRVLSTRGIDAAPGVVGHTTLDEDWLADRVREGLTAEEIARLTRGSMTAPCVRRELKRRGFSEPNGSSRRVADLQSARELHAEIAKGIELVSRSWVWLSGKLHAFHEGKCWEALGYDTLESWLQSPDIGLSRSQFFRLVRVWERLVVDAQVAPERLHGVNLERLDVISRVGGRLPVETRWPTCGS